MPELSLEARMAKEAWKFYANKEFVDALRPVAATALRNVHKLAAEAQVEEEVLITLEYQRGREQLSEAAVTQIRKALDFAVKAAATGGVQKDDVTTEKRKMDAIRCMLGHVVRLHRALEASRPAQQGRSR
jgi:hypothetical protein